MHEPRAMQVLYSEIITVPLVRLLAISSTRDVSAWAGPGIVVRDLHILVDFGSIIERLRTPDYKNR